MATSVFTPEDEALIRKEFEGLRLASLKRCADQEQYDLVLDAFEFANEAHRNVRRRSGEPYILHPIAVAKIVVQEIGLGCKSICAALLHDVVEDTDFTTDDIRRRFGDRIAILVDGLTKIKNVLDNDSRNRTSSLQAENFRRILLTLNDDARIILIKLADRLHNVRTIQYMPEYKREKILSETMYLFVPLAHRLGLYNIKSEMENIWLQYKEPVVYREIEERLEKIQQEKGNALDRFMEPLGEILERAGYRCRIIKRVKTHYSIWNKMEKKHIPFDEIFDLYAVRIIFEPKEGLSEREQCWQIFSKITGKYHYLPERTRDWVNMPKNNGYEALHLTVMADGSWVEIQIRSERMNSIAERGIAAHWAYKKGAGDSPRNDADVDNWLKHVQEILENPDANALQFLDNFHNEILASEIYVFTPKGEAKSMPKGSTLLDFAYLIHSHIGNTAIAGKVNMRLVPLSYVLSNGDQVEIINSATSHPKREWLDFLKTTRARNHVIDSLKDDTVDYTQVGQRLLQEKLDGLGITLQSRVLKKLSTYYNIISGKEELYNKIGVGIISLDDIDTALKTNQEHRSVQIWGFKLLSPKKNEEKINKKEEYLLKENLDDGTVSFKIANCCSPIPGDNVVGVIGEDNTVTIHKTSCPEYTNFAATHGDQIVAVRWSKHFVMSFLARISISGIDRIGILNDISKEISTVLEINIRKIYIEAHDEVFEGYIDLYVHNTENLENLMQTIRKIKGVEKVIRTEIK